jgi:polar amino acid transport system substrate-binding protein
MMKKFVFAFMPLLVALNSCDQYPRDAKGTLNRVQGKVLKVGLSGYDSTANTSDRNVHLELHLIQSFAQQVHARVEWVRGPQSEIIKLLHNNHLDMAIGGYTSPSPFEKEVSFTKPYFTERVVIAVPSNQSAPESIKGKKVTVTNHMVASVVKKKGGIPEFLDSLSSGSNLTAAALENLSGSGLKPTALVLNEEKFVIAVPKGENAFLIKLEHFLDTYGQAK